MFILQTNKIMRGIYKIIFGFRLNSVRSKVKEWLIIHRRPRSPENDKEIADCINVLSKFLPEPLKVQEFLRRFSDNLFKEESTLAGRCTSDGNRDKSYFR